ncbi:hypothetical protein K4F52_008087 [Lecanicillium sp. MT-2017a]|nr:hypothetical protein K4F52_008087 [Lecanicillium sp. MT-2017a]
MSGTIDAIGLVGSVLGIVGFFENLVPAAPPDRGATVRVKLGLSDDDDGAQIDGTIDAIYAWDINNNYLGQSGGSYIKEGDIHDFIIDQDSGGTRSEYVGLAAANNALCIAWITVSQLDNTRGGAWTGDIGYNCGNDWYPSTEPAGKLDNGDRYIPYCSWLDADHSNDLPYAAMKFSTYSYGDGITDTNDNSRACDATIFGRDQGPISGKPAKRSRGLKPRQPWMERQLIVSSLAEHYAEIVCSSDTSWGPDFVGSDGMFCDMGTKTLSPLCSTEEVDGCVNINTTDNTVSKLSSVAKRQVEMSYKTYDKIKQWS